MVRCAEGFMAPQNEALSTVLHTIVTNVGAPRLKVFITRNLNKFKGRGRCTRKKFKKEIKNQYRDHMHLPESIH